MLDATDLAIAYTVPCPKTACAAFCGEQCISFVTGKAVEIPHRERVEAARQPHPIDRPAHGPNRRTA